MTDSKFRSRKWIFTCFVAIVATGFTASGLLTGTEWSALMGTIGIAYSWANVKDPDKQR